MFGGGAAFLGFVIYSAVGIITGLEIGYVSLLVGFLVGMAMKKGTGGVGGRKYQITAAVLTYAAVSMSAIPISIHYEKEHSVQQQSAAPASDAKTGGNASAEQANEAGQDRSENFGLTLGTLLLLGLASPFLELAQSPVSGLIGLVILYVGINFAWRQTAANPLSVDGPYDNAPKSVTATAG